MSAAPAPPSSASDPPVSRLLALPAELRNSIWSYLLVRPASVTSDDHAIHCRILQVSRQINDEATPILYGENRFNAHPSLLATLPSLRPGRADLGNERGVSKRYEPVKHPRPLALIRRFCLYLRLDTDPRFTAAQVEASFTGAEELDVEVFQSMYGACDFTKLRLFEGVRGVKKAVVDGSVGDGKYASWLAHTMMLPEGAGVQPYTEEYVGGHRAWDAWSRGNR